MLLLDIDGLRADVLESVLTQKQAPNLARLLGGEDFARGLLRPVVASAPSITFTSQACLFTGEHPAQHGVPGNQFFDRFGSHSNGVPRHYAFDVGDTLAADDAVRVFTDGLASGCLLVPTLYEQVAERGWRSVVAGHMYARGATSWLRPSLVNLTRFTKGGKLFGMDAATYDRTTLNRVCNDLSEYGTPNLLTVYFMGVDHESHAHGPQAQKSYLIEVLDGLVGELWNAILDTCLPSAPKPICLIFSDHGQIGVPADDHHSLRLSFPYDRELGHLFDALGLDVHDFPGEDPACDAVVASNGGLAMVYLQNRHLHWADSPDFKRDVLPVARAFWQAHESGRYATELEGAVAGVLVRNVERNGWNASYQALTSQGEVISLSEWFESQPANLYIDPVNRIQNLASALSGDLIVISNYAEGFYFASPLKGMHGGLNPGDSWAALALGWPDVSEDAWLTAKQTFTQSIEQRCLVERQRLPATADVLVGLKALL